MSDIARHSIPRFETPEQARLRETKLADWWLQAVQDDRAETALPPVELWKVAGHG